jgi:predicted ribosomally synthesized peptide with SipW-like signal peptide
VKKIIGLSIAVVLIIVTVGGSTWAYFSDFESSTNNSMVVGTLDLKIDGGDTAVNTFTVADVEPGDSGSGASILANSGSLSGELDVTFSTVTNIGGTGGGEYEDGIGHLGGVAQMAVYIDVDQSGSWSSGDIGLKSDSSNYYYPTALAYDIINNYDSDYFNAVETMAASAADNFRVEWSVPSGAGNNIQGDSVSFGVTFTLEQTGAD